MAVAPDHRALAMCQLCKRVGQDKQVGAMKFSPLVSHATDVKCPVCFALPNHRCIQKNGDPASTSHAARRIAYMTRLRMGKQQRIPVL